MVFIISVSTEFSSRPNEVGIAIDVNLLNRIDTAQMYKNEVEAGIALRESGLSRSDVFVTTKWSGTDGLDVETSIQNSLKNVYASTHPIPSERHD